MRSKKIIMLTSREMKHAASQIMLIVDSHKTQYQGSGI